mmetsp:Transcript_25515/g.33344  ORF Transcript_25515/g.33344 Transcript_25515/m.33344 type:complete len:148 (+) Transcript_25515:40-483(+)|eukprot:CAMPEP_0117798244 /NCGR_PEP_ID=MMETSP0948-20121206/13025_1 /TAXON_ID=44440 /ORGANISM="Chattonella subsalsa, Strain CCMP2191" /LENGTH=147 /DNA_ID=CAMNT_0005629827 /DNA_START=84 /DNA_END=527 /DNA_ORIENTATION=-
MSRRLTKELQDLESSPLDYVTCGPINDDIMHWNAMLMGPENSPYYGGIFNLDIEFPSEYPFKPPKVKFVTKIYHPNIKTDTGEICADLLSEGWGPTLNIRHVLGLMKQLLAEPSTDSPLETEIAGILSENPGSFNETASKWTSDYAT